MLIKLGFALLAYALVALLAHGPIYRFFRAAADSERERLERLECQAHGVTIDGVLSVAAWALASVWPVTAVIMAIGTLTNLGRR